VRAGCSKGRSRARRLGSSIIASLRKKTIGLRGRVGRAAWGSPQPATALSSPVLFQPTFNVPRMCTRAPRRPETPRTRFPLAGSSQAGARPRFASSRRRRWQWAHGGQAKGRRSVGATGTERTRPGTGRGPLALGPTHPGVATGVAHTGALQGKGLQVRALHNTSSAQ
jgi:hypothetical protein